MACEIFMRLCGAKCACEAQNVPARNTANRWESKEKPGNRCGSRVFQMVRMTGLENVQKIRITRIIKPFFTFRVKFRVKRG